MLSMALAVGVGGCAAPNTPGAGVGADYTPVLDAAGADQTRYQADLAECRALARSVDVGSSAVTGAIIGALLGGALASAYGGGGQVQLDTANYGGMLGGSKALGDAAAQQKSMMINCMTGRGYRALEVAPAVVVHRVASPPSESRAGNRSARVTDPQSAAAQPIGRESHQVERTTEAKACAPQPVARLLGRGEGGVETYAVSCASGDVLTFRCQFGVCRVMQ